MALPFRDRARIVLFRWPAVVAGLSVALGIHIVLTAFGLGVVLQQQSADGGSSMAAAGLLVWSGFAWVMASFIQAMSWPGWLTPPATLRASFTGWCFGAP